MSTIEWFYAQAGRQRGPVSPAEIKRLADAGQLKPDDLVWREGMTEWAPAARVQGLFENAASPFSSPASATDEREPPAEAPETSEPSDFSEPEETPGEPASPTPRPARHVFEVLLDSARAQCGAPFVDSTTRGFAVCGHYGLYAVMLIAIVFGVALSVKTESGGVILLAAAVVVALAAFQYGARRSIEALERLSHTAGGCLASTALTDGIAALSMMSGVILLLALAMAAIDSGQFTYIPTGLLLFIVFEHIGFVAVAPANSGILLDPDAPPAEEALGLLAFLLKLMIRVAPVLFGVGVLWAGIYLLVACFWLFYSAESFGVARGTALYALGWAFGYAALPMLAHAFFLGGELTVEIVRRFLSAETRFEER